MNKLFYLCAFQLLTLSYSHAQPAGQLTLNDCYTLAKQNYPLIRQRELIAIAADYTVDNIRKGYLPQLNINGQATYQSAVTQVPVKLSNAAIPDISKDQYKFYGEINQLVYDGGVLGQQKQLAKGNAAVEQQQLETSLYELKERINQLYFGVLLIDEQIKQNELLIKNVQLGLNKVQAAIKNGAAFKSNGDVIRADLLKTKQHTIELQASRKAYADMLSLFTGRGIDSQTVLAKPGAVIASKQINRPELLVYDEQSKNLDVQNKMITAKALPKLNAFFQGGMGRPALNMLSGGADAYYIGGIRFTWSPSAFYTIKKERALINISRRNLGVQKETFLFNTNLTVKQQDAEIGKYQQLLASDNEIIELRDKVKTTAMAQLENGVINGNDFLSEVNAEDQARQNKILHEIQLLMAQHNQKTTTGN
ncbi:TolC family protein [Mucilaginibacter aquariorum]|uniref:TolC family protein n=1 Tax=Mucilaginibacter aquariorum TaxID=2967225 RepID=A0ABT1SVH5_9SPHI|nr:TolC family protein [Mucilaginibacter aquariorum]MCQ6956344.1 TolC family protein [Mucilaginibacter aquariorum]